MQVSQSVSKDVFPSLLQVVPSLPTNNSQPSKGALTVIHAKSLLSNTLELCRLHTVCSLLKFLPLSSRIEDKSGSQWFWHVVMWLRHTQEWAWNAWNTTGPMWKSTRGNNPRAGQASALSGASQIWALGKQQGFLGNRSGRQTRPSFLAAVTLPISQYSPFPNIVRTDLACPSLSAFWGFMNLHLQSLRENLTNLCFLSLTIYIQPAPLLSYKPTSSVHSLSLSVSRPGNLHPLEVWVVPLLHQPPAGTFSSREKAQAAFQEHLTDADWASLKWPSQSRMPDNRHP